MRAALLGMIAAALLAVGGPASANTPEPYLAGGIHWPGAGVRTIRVLDEVQLTYARQRDRNAWHRELKAALRAWEASGAVTFTVTLWEPTKPCGDAVYEAGFVVVCRGGAPTVPAVPGYSNALWDPGTLHITAAFANVGPAGAMPRAMCEQGGRYNDPTPVSGCILRPLIEHELGHTMGLAHNLQSVASVMGSGSRPNADDFANLWALYAHDDDEATR